MTKIINTKLIEDLFKLEKNLEQVRFPEEGTRPRLESLLVKIEDQYTSSQDDGERLYLLKCSEVIQRIFQGMTDNKGYWNNVESGKTDATEIMDDIGKKI